MMHPICFTLSFFECLSISKFCFYPSLNNLYYLPIFQLYSSLSIVVTNFVEVTETVEGFNSLSDVKQALVAITMFAVLWGGGGILICALFRRQRLRVVATAQGGGLKRDIKTRDEARKYLIAYVDEVFPAVFQTSSRLLRLLSEVMKHHRYLTVFSPYGDVSDGRRMLICLQLLTVQSMVMFMIAVLYEIQVRPIVICSRFLFNYCLL
jgi:hypothetical protein